MDFWIDDPCRTIAYQCLDGGYIPYAPHGGRMIMDDFGNLQQALPSDYYQELPRPIYYYRMWGYKLPLQH